MLASPKWGMPNELVGFLDSFVRLKRKNRTHGRHGCDLIGYVSLRELFIDYNITKSVMSITVPAVTVANWVCKAAPFPSAS
jgi:hypothetical protein